jgi:hypothetical protein
MRISTRLPLVVLTALLATLTFAATPALAGSALVSPGFGIERFAFGVQNENGTPDVQAGSHPYALTASFVLHEPPCFENGEQELTCLPESELKDAKVGLPPGFVGDPNATPKCTYQEFINFNGFGAKYEGGHCSPETAVGVATSYTGRQLDKAGGVTERKYYAGTDPVYNLVPPPGVAAEFGFIVAKQVPVLLQTSVRTGSDYGLTTVASDVGQAKWVAASKVTIWGTPADPVHNKFRGYCENSIYAGPTPEETNEPPDEVVGYGLREGEDELETPEDPALEFNKSGIPRSEGACESNAPQVPLLTNPTSCGVSRTATLSVDGWKEPGNFLTGEHVAKAEASLPPLSGCEKLDFSPTIGVKPGGEAGSTPTGLNVGVHVPQETTENPVGLAEADVKTTTVTLPAGMQLSPSAADGLQACSNAQAGFEHYEELDNSGMQTAIFKPKVYNPTTQVEEATLCPDASKVANVKIKTPLLEGELEGSVYLAAPQNFQGLPENPFSSLFALYLVAEEPKAGVLVKVAGKVSPNPVTGQITTTFENTPQLPYSDLELEFYGGDRAPLSTPSYCGTYNTAATFEPWSGEEPKAPLAEFPINSGPNGSSCTYPGQALPFAPSLASDTTVTNAGAFTPLDTTLTREDGQQQIQQVTLHYPEGLTGLISGVALCGEAEANAGTCGPASEIGETIVSVGQGNDPYSVVGGKVYLTGPYEGAPFGLSIENPAKAGPFYLEEGRPVVVRAKIEINPLTAALTVTTNTAAEGHAIPTILDGIPLQIKHVAVNITRPGFTINPTSCSKAQVTGTVESAEKASAPVSIPFQVGECRSLAFAPKLAASASGKTSKADGASLSFKFTNPSTPQGTQANFAKFKVDLPKQLPSRLTTLQKACTAKQFEANPAGCPAASVVGHMVVHTPLVPVPLEGPLYFVSNGGEAFPNLIVVLQGYGVTAHLVGDTFISKAGITSSTFNAIPDIPFTSAEVTLPEGKYSALAANGNLCTDKLAIPTAFVGQNGAEIHNSTPLGVIGCAKVKALTRAQKLQKALKACRSKDKKNKGRRQKCEAKARKQYGAAKRKKK